MAAEIQRLQEIKPSTHFKKTSLDDWAYGRSYKCIKSGTFIAVKEKVSFYW